MFWFLGRLPEMGGCHHVESDQSPRERSEALPPLWREIFLLFPSHPPVLLTGPLGLPPAIDGEPHAAGRGFFPSATGTGEPCMAPRSHSQATLCAKLERPPTSAEGSVCTQRGPDPRITYSQRNLHVAYYSIRHNQAQIMGLALVCFLYTACLDL